MIKYLVADLNDGVGNRISLLLCCLRIAKLLNLQLITYWPINDFLGAEYDSLLRTHQDLVIHREDASEHFKMMLPNSLALKKEFCIECDPLDLEFYDAIIVGGWRWAKLIDEDIAQVLSELPIIFDSLEFNPYIQERLAGFQDVSDCVGVHVRRGDLINNENARHRERAISEKEYFESEVLVSEQIFLCTECLAVVNSFEQHFDRDRLIRYPSRSFDRSSMVAAQDALIELILLSRTKHIVAGPSSFSRLASVIGQKELTVLTPENMESEQILI